MPGNGHQHVVALAMPLHRAAHDEVDFAQREAPELVPVEPQLDPGFEQSGPVYVFLAAAFRFPGAPLTDGMPACTISAISRPLASSPNLDIIVPASRRVASGRE